MARTHVVEAHKVTALELFFDLVFVFAITQVTGLLAADLTAAGFQRGLLILALLWWAWVAYAWLTNTLHAEHSAARIVLLAATGAMLIVSLAVPRALGADAIAFAIPYAVVRVLHVVLYWLSTRGDEALHGAAVRLTPPLLAGSALLVVGAFVGGGARVPLWLAAVAIDYAGPLLAGSRGWRIDVEHFVERHGLIVIIALGEAIVSVGVGAAGLTLDAPVIGSALLAVAIAGALWWAYFDVVALEAERRLARASAEEQPALARDAWSYLHLPMVAGIVLFALGVKKSVAHPTHALDAIPSLALYGGVGLYFLGHVAFRWRVLRSTSWMRLFLALALAGGVVLGQRIPALSSLALIAGGCAAVVTFETIRYREWRASLRQGH